MEIREALPEDAEIISDLIQGVAHYFTLERSGIGAEHFFNSITPDAIASYISDPNIYYIAAFQGHKLAGAAALRNGNHIFHLFVAPSYQGKGLSRCLWNTLKHKINKRVEEITVNSTPYAVPIYERFGFRVTGPKVEMNGIAFVPMKRLVANNYQ